MEWQSKLRWLLVIAHVAAAVALCVAADLKRFPQPSELLVAASISLATCQVYLAAAWGVLSRARWQTRSALAIAPVTAWAWTFGGNGDDFLNFLAFFLPVAGAAAILAWVARFVWGYRLTDTVTCDASDIAPKSRQFSLRALMIWMSVAAVACAMLRVLIAPWLQEGDEMWPFLAATVLRNTVLLYVWFQIDKLGIKRVLVLLIVAVAAMMLQRASSARADPMIGKISLFECVFTAVTLQALRVSGIRLTRMTAGNRPSNGHVTESETAPLADS